MIIRKALPEHAREIILLVDESANHSLRKNKPEILQLQRPKTLRSIELRLIEFAKEIGQLSDDDKMLVAIENGYIVGYSHGLRCNGRGLLLSLYVLPDFQNKKIGTKLLAEMLEWFSGMTVTLSIPTLNRSVIRFYSRFGFVLDFPEDEFGNDLGIESHFMRKDP